ncbi:MAG: succinate dehydrogenase cytochrome b558 subunit [Polyangiaceae bacterium]
MSEHTQTESPLTEKHRRAFLMRKLHSLSGVVPVGGFMLFHLWTNAKATQGREPFDQAVRDISHMPFVTVMEWGLILLPLLFHAIYGVFIALNGRQNFTKYTYSRNWMYFLQRLSGLVAFAFIGMHLYQYWGQKVAGKMETGQFYQALCESLSSTKGGAPWMAIAYVVGIAACAFHFANGLWGFCFSWGITVSRRSQRMASSLFGLVGVVVFFLGLNTVVHFATGESVTNMIERTLFGHGEPAKNACQPRIEATPQPAAALDAAGSTVSSR